MQKSEKNGITIIKGATFFNDLNTLIFKLERVLNRNGYFGASRISMSVVKGKPVLVGTFVSYYQYQKTISFDNNEITQAYNYLYEFISNLVSGPVYKFTVSVPKTTTAHIDTFTFKIGRGKQSNSGKYWVTYSSDIG